MIKFSIDESNIKELEIQGDVCTLSAELSMLISRMYRMIKDEDADIAEEFKQLTIGQIEMPFMSSEELAAKTLEALLKMFANSKEESEKDD